ncbi:MAG TPA: SpoIIE family protein phosphatase [Acidobacteriota bacterium]|jgi:sigma-B regulation protein RsbU (phosphoserine phosphatase)
MTIVRWDNLKRILKPQRRITRLTLLGLILFAIGELVERSVPDSIFSILTTVGLVLLFIGGIYFFFRFVAWLQRRLLWKVRNKILVSYAFIGIVPLVLISIMTWLMAKLVFGQLGAFYVRSAIEEVLSELDEMNTDLHLQQARTLASPGPASENDAMRLVPEQARRDYPDLQLRIYRERSGSYQELPSGRPLPSWIKPPKWKGITIEQGVLSLQSIRFSPPGQGDYATEVSLPLNRGLVETLKQKTGVEISQFSPAAGSEEQKSASPNRSAITIRIGPNADKADPNFKPSSRSVWVLVLQPQERSNGDVSLAAFSLLAPLSIRDIFNYYFQNSREVAKFLYVLLLLVGGALLFVELVSVVIGLVIARSITRSVHQLSLGTSSILAGNFDYRVAASDRDQLGQLAQTFNQMSSRIQQLLVESAEKQRLEKEIEIAREVQSQLFPRYVPKSSRLDLSGTCLPAQGVSGDYYDFLSYSNSIDLIIGDISGKGISAALLMANLQSTIRSHAGVTGATTPDGVGGIARIVHLINRQLYDNTLPEKYATLFYGRYSMDESALLYCNAGHNPPLLFCNGSVSRLEEGGTVVGLFDSSVYRESKLILKKGNLLVLYTDGLTEAQNPDGQEFGERRLVDLISAHLSLSAARLQYLITDEIQKWMSGGAQSDDITLVVARVN